jgi:hypothetical protein
MRIARRFDLNVSVFAVAMRGSQVLLLRRSNDFLAWFEIEDLPQNVIPYTRQGLLLSRAGVPFSAFGWPSPHDGTGDRKASQHRT